MLWEKVIVEESGWCWWWLVPAAEPPGSTVTLEWALRRTVPATAVSDLSMHNCVPMHKSHCADAHCIAHWTINIAVSMWRWWSTEAASCCTFPRRLKRATQSDRGALLSFPLLICSQVDVLARIWHKSSLPILAFTVPFCQHQVAVTFSLTPAQHPLSSSAATASLYLWPIQAKLLFLHYLIYAKSKHGSQPFQRQPFWHFDKKNIPVMQTWHTASSE